MRETYSTLEEKAEAFAALSHQFQYRKDNTTPAIFHPRNVVSHLKRLGIRNQDVLCGGWLHDVVEDCSVDMETLGYEFNPNVARIVGKLTRSVGMSREEYKDIIRNSDYDVKIIKIADVTDNCSNLRAPYLKRDSVSRFVNDCSTLYLGMAREISPRLYSILIDEIDGIEGFSKNIWEGRNLYYNLPLHQTL
jgi:guanosine-3',5'-bis(diphosphate) 3'-pyrophosphohydrolase